MRDRAWARDGPYFPATDYLAAANSYTANPSFLAQRLPSHLLLPVRFVAVYAISMLFSQDRTQLRRFFFSVWRKHQAREPMEPLEGMIADVISQHPEYHALLGDEEAALDRDYLPELGESNPFLHLAMHLAMREQLGTQQPAGIVEIYQKLAAIRGSAHDAEHAMMDCLGEMLWQAQRDGNTPDEQRYLECLKKMVKR